MMMMGRVAGDGEGEDERDRLMSPLLVVTSPQSTCHPSLPHVSAVFSPRGSG